MELTIEGKRIRLRKLKKSDAPSIAQHARDREISRYTFIPHPYKLEDAQSFIRKTHQNFRRKLSYDFGIEFKEAGQIIGMISLMNVNKRSRNAEVGYWLGKKYWRRGLTEEALRLVLDFGFRKLRLMRIHAPVMQPNRASAKLLEKCGFQLEGRLRKCFFKNRRWMDELRYGILEEEFRKKYRGSVSQ